MTDNVEKQQNNNIGNSGISTGGCTGKGFKRGQSGNINGRPKKEKCFSDIARALLASKKIDIEYTFPKKGAMVTSKMHIESDKTIYHSLVVALIKEGLDGNVNAIRELIDRTDGKPQQHIDHTTNQKDLHAIPEYDFTGVDPDTLRDACKIIDSATIANEE